MPTVCNLLDRAEASIRRSKNVDLWRVSDARVNAEELLEKVLGKEITSELLDDQVTPSKARRYETLVARRTAGEPVAVIVGYTDFMNMRLLVRRDVFIPRNSSEFLATKAIARLRSRKSPVAVDVATGIGPVALAVARSASHARIYGLDVWMPSLKVAKSNAERLKIRNVQFVKSDMLSGLPRGLRGRIDVFTIHPPYVARSAVRGLPREIKNYEPKVSLSDNSSDGMGLVRRIAAGAPEWLRPSGWLLVEVSPDLSRKVATILRAEGFRDVKSSRDSLGATRVVAGRL